MQYLSFCVWLISLSIMPSSSIHGVANVRISLFFKVENTPLCMYVCMYVCLYIHFSFISVSHFLYQFICQNVGWFYILATVNNATEHTGVQTRHDSELSSFGYISKCGTVGSYWSWQQSFGCNRKITGNKSKHKWDDMKLKCFCIAKKTSNKMKR